MGIIDVKLFSIERGTLVVNLSGKKAKNEILDALTVFVVWIAMVFGMFGRGEK
ncbi:MAG: hypothetical protein WCX64_03945 [Candidatus Micrarchaeia archaeon]